MRTAILCVAVLFLIAADAPTTPSQVAQKKYEQAVQHANDVYAKMIAAADKQYLADLDAAAKRAKGQEAESVESAKSDFNSQRWSHDKLGEAKVVLGVPPKPVAKEDLGGGDEVQQAMRKHQVIKGMTEQQMKAAFDFKHPDEGGGRVHWQATAPTVNEEDDVKVYHWTVGYLGGGQFNITRRVTVWLKAGIVEKVQQTREEQFDTEPD